MTTQSSGTASNHEYLINQAQIKAIEGSTEITLAGVIAPIIDASSKKEAQRSEAGSDARLSAVKQAERAAEAARRREAGPSLARAR